MEFPLPSHATLGKALDFPALVFSSVNGISSTFHRRFSETVGVRYAPEFGIFHLQTGDPGHLLYMTPQPTGL